VLGSRGDRRIPTQEHGGEGIAHTSRVASALVLSSKPAGARVRATWPWGPIGACAYLAGFALPLPWDLPLMLLAVMSLLAILSGSRHRPASWPPLSLPVLGFVVATGVAMLGSTDVARSLHLSAALLPALLLFVLIADHFPDFHATRLLYLTCCAVSLGLAAALLWGIWKAGAQPPSVSTVLAVGSPILLVQNDSTFLAVLAPLALVMLYHRPRSLGGIVAVLALLVSGGVIVLLQSRTALLTMLISLMCAAALLRPHRRLAFALGCGLTLVALALLIDGCLGFPLLAKVVRERQGSGRGDLWRAAWAMFLDAPWAGHGPHTFARLYPWYHGTCTSWACPVRPRFAHGHTISISRCSRSGASSDFSR
jgi:O-antigen ligase